MLFRIRAVRVVLRVTLSWRLVAQVARLAARVRRRVPFTGLVLCKVHEIFAAGAPEAARRGRRGRGPGVRRLFLAGLLPALLLRLGGARRRRLVTGPVAGSEGGGGGCFGSRRPWGRRRDGVTCRFLAFDNANDVVDRFCGHGGVAEHLAANLDVVDACQENVPHYGVGVVDAPAVGGGAPEATHSVGARDDEVTVRHSAADGRGEVAERLAHLLFALQGLASADAD